MSDFYGSVQLWHPAGVKVTLPVPVTAEQAQEVNYELALKFVGDALSAGWMTNAPGLEQGEEKEQVGWVLRGDSEGRNGLCPYLLLYAANEALSWSFLKVYLNTKDDEAEFERASGLTVAKLPSYIGKDKPERGKDRRVDAFMIRPSRPLEVVYKQNPKWKQEDAEAAAAKKEMYKVPRRVFVRWSGADAAPKAKQGDPDTYLGRWEHFLSAEPPLAELNARLPELSKLGEEDKRLVWDAIKVHAGKNRLAWSKERRQFEVTDNMADYL